MGRPCSRCAGVPAIFQKYFGSKYDAEVLAVGGVFLTLLENARIVRKVSIMALACLLLHFQMHSLRSHILGTSPLLSHWKFQSEPIRVRLPCGDSLEGLIKAVCRGMLIKQCSFRGSGSAPDVALATWPAVHAAPAAGAGSHDRDQ